MVEKDNTVERLGKIEVSVKNSEDDIKELKCNDKDKGKALVEIEKSNIRSEANLEATLLLVKNVAGDVKDIKDKKLVDSKHMKWLVVTFILSNLVGIIAIIAKYFKYLKTLIFG